MNTADTITKKLTQALEPEALEVIDESEKHHGHAGWREAGETHYRVRIRAKAFAGTSRLDRHRKINEILAEELAGSVHALAIEAEAAD